MRNAGQFSAVMGMEVNTLLSEGTGRSSAKVEKRSAGVERRNVGNGRVMISQHMLSICWAYLGTSPLNLRAIPSKA